MPADYSSTAKALALPISPTQSPSPDERTTRPPWSRRISAGSRRSPYTTTSRTTNLHTYKDQFLHSASEVQRKVIDTFQRLSPVQRILAVIILILSVVLGILFLVFNERIFSMLTPWAEKWRDIRGGWLILWATTFIAAFPPLIGYSTTVTIAGFVYGFPNGWLVAASATVAGSLASFIASRTVLSGYVHRLVGQDKRFEALALILKHDGLKILCMIRFCPLPYSLSNAAMSTFPTVHPLSFALATAIASPKLLIHVFIGSRLAKLADSGGKMDASTKAVNYASIIFGSVLGAAVGYIIYQRTIARAKELEIAEFEAGRAEAGLAGRGSSGSYNDEGFTEESDAAALMDDDDISLWDNDEGSGGARRDGDGSTGYRDDFTDEDDVFASGDGDGDAAGRGRGKAKR